MDEEGREEVVPEGLKGGGETFILIMRFHLFFINYEVIQYFILFIIIKM